GVAATKARMAFHHPLRHEIRPNQHVRREALGLRQELMACGHDAAREVARGVDEARAPGAVKRVRHFARDGFEPARKNRHARDHQVTSMVPEVRRRAVLPRGTKMVVKEDSMITGPASGASNGTSENARTGTSARPPPGSQTWRSDLS